VATIDSGSLHCSARGCLYETAPGTLGLFCTRHWEFLPRYLRHILKKEDERSQDAGARTGRWLRLCRAAVELVAMEEALSALSEERGWLRKKGEELLEVAVA
jgi:hypothetical protein